MAACGVPAVNTSPVCAPVCPPVCAPVCAPFCPPVCASVCASVCACKGARSCLLCERGARAETEEAKVVRHFVYDTEKGRAICRDGEDEGFDLPGVFLLEDFISAEEEAELVAHMDQSPWTLSQSGRCKQDFGPKVNFKKQKVRMGLFCGLPLLSRSLVKRMQQQPALSDFCPVEQCNLDYRPERGAHIEPHLDDAWLWGERLVTVNMLSDTSLTLSQLQGPTELQVCVPLPRRSLLVLSGPARHTWKHAIHRAHICHRRVCSTFRELSPEFQPGGAQAELGARLTDIALSYSGAPL